MNWKQHEKSSPFPESNWKWTAFLTGSANVQQACQLQIERRVLRARNRGSFRTRRGGFFRCGRRHCGACAPAGHIGLVLCGHPGLGPGKPVRIEGEFGKGLCVSSVFSKHQGNGHTQAESVPSVYFSRYHMPPCPPEKLLLAFKYTRPGVVTVNSSILSLRAAKQPQQNRTCCGFAWFNVLKALCAREACALHTRGGASGGLRLLYYAAAQRPQQTARAAVLHGSMFSKPCAPYRRVPCTRAAAQAAALRLLYHAAAQRPQQNRTCCGFCMVQCSQSPVRQHRGVCHAHAQPRKRRL